MEEYKPAPHMKELSEAVVMVIKMLEYAEDNLADGFQPFEDAAAAMKLLGPIREGIEGIGEIPKSFEMMTVKDSRDLLAYVKHTLDLENDRLEEIIEFSVDIVLKVVEMWVLLKKS